MICELDEMLIRKKTTDKKNFPKNCTWVLNIVKPEYEKFCYYYFIMKKLLVFLSKADFCRSFKSSTGCSISVKNLYRWLEIMQKAESDLIEYQSSGKIQNTIRLKQGKRKIKE